MKFQEFILIENNFVLDKEFNNRVKQEQFHELLEKDLGLRYSRFYNLI